MDIAVGGLAARVRANRIGRWSIVHGGISFGIMAFVAYAVGILSTSFAVQGSRKGTAIGASCFIEKGVF